MFLEPQELRSAIYDYQLEEIVEITTGNQTNEDIILMAINAAIEEIGSYLRPNSQAQWKDGRAKYDVEAIFSATGTARNALILELTKNIAVWYVVRLSNVDVLTDKVQDRYDRAIAWLEKVSGTGKAAGTPALTPGLPLLTVSSGSGSTGGTTSGDGTSGQTIDLPFRFGSREKFNHE